MSKVTIKTIAEKAGVSIGTVDRALHGRGRISQETKDKILSIAYSEGYRPNKIASTLRKGKLFRIAIVMARNPQYFTEELVAGIEKAKEELEDYKFVFDYYFSDTLSADEQEKILDNIDPSKYDGVVLNAGSVCLRPHIASLVEKGVDLITFNTDDEKSRRLFYVGEDPYRAGCVAGELMGKMMRVKGNVLIIAGLEGVSSHILRIEGFSDALKRVSPDVEIKEIWKCNDDQKLTLEYVMHKIQSGEKIDGIFCVTTPGLIGVAECLKEIKHQPLPCLIGYDLTSKSASYVKDGYCAAIMYQDPKSQSYYAISLLAKHLMGVITADKKRYLTRTKIVLSENLEDYLNLDNIDSSIIV